MLRGARLDQPLVIDAGQEPGSRAARVGQQRLALELGVDQGFGPLQERFDRRIDEALLGGIGRKAGARSGIGRLEQADPDADLRRRLEYGHSDQAPQGMVRLTIAEFKGIVDDAARAVAQ